MISKVPKLKRNETLVDKKDSNEKFVLFFYFSCNETPEKNEIARILNFWIAVAPEMFALDSFIRYKLGNFLCHLGTYMIYFYFSKNKPPFNHLLTTTKNSFTLGNIEIMFRSRYSKEDYKNRLTNYKEGMILW